MDWNTILQLLLSGGIVGTIVEVGATIRNRKANKKIKDSEAATANVESQKAEIELADLYKDKMLAMLEQMQAGMDKGNVNQEEMIEMIKDVGVRVDGLRVDVNDIIGCLNGTFTDYLAHKGDKHNKIANA